MVDAREIHGAGHPHPETPHPRRARRRSLTDHVSHTTICVIGDHPGHWGGSHASRVHVCRPKAKRLRRWYSKNYHGAVG